MALHTLVGGSYTWNKKNESVSFQTAGMKLVRNVSGYTRSNRIGNEDTLKESKESREMVNKLW
jgi:hypothetical protein